MPFVEYSELRLSHARCVASRFGEDLPRMAHIISTQDLHNMLDLPAHPQPPQDMLLVVGSELLSGLYHPVLERQKNSAPVFARLESSVVTMTIFKLSEDKWVFGPKPWEQLVFAELSTGSVNVPTRHAKWLSPGSRNQLLMKVRLSGKSFGIQTRDHLKSITALSAPEPSRGRALATPTELLQWRWHQQRSMATVQRRPCRVRDNCRSDLVVFNETFVKRGYRSCISFFDESEDTKHLLQLGGNNGMVARWALQQQGILTVDVYEPGKENFFLTWYNTLRLPVRVHNAAVGTHEGTMKFCDQTHTSRGSLRSCLACHLDGNVAGNQYEVTVLPFDSVLQDHHHELIIDIEGGELPILLNSNTNFKSLKLIKGEISGVRLRKKLGNSGWMAFGKILNNLRRAGFTHIKYDSLAEDVRYWQGTLRSCGLDFKIMASRDRRHLQGKSPKKKTRHTSAGRYDKYRTQWLGFKSRMARRLALSSPFARTHRFALCNYALVRSYAGVCGS